MFNDGVSKKNVEPDAIESSMLILYPTMIPFLSDNGRGNHSITASKEFTYATFKLTGKLEGTRKKENYSIKRIISHHLQQ